MNNSNRKNEINCIPEFLHFCIHVILYYCIPTMWHPCGTSSTQDKKIRGRGCRVSREAFIQGEENSKKDESYFFLLYSSLIVRISFGYNIIIKKHVKNIFKMSKLFMLHHQQQQ
jgi:hypothetical protein